MASNRCHSALLNSCGLCRDPFGCWLHFLRRILDIHSVRNAKIDRIFNKHFLCSEETKVEETSPHRSHASSLNWKLLTVWTHSVGSSPTLAHHVVCLDWNGSSSWGICVDQIFYAAFHYIRMPRGIWNWMAPSHLMLSAGHWLKRWPSQIIVSWLRHSTWLRIFDFLH